MDVNRYGIGKTSRYDVSSDLKWVVLDWWNPTTSKFFVTYHDTWWQAFKAARRYNANYNSVR
jgi:hypothetical protein